MRIPRPNALVMALAAACASAAPGGPETTVTPVTTSLVSTGVNTGGTGR